MAQRTHATVLHTLVDRLNQGDVIRNQTGQTMKIHRIRPHEQSNRHVYLDTDGGSVLMDRTDSIDVVPHNPQQQELPGMGVPGGNTNALPWGSAPGASNEAGGTCPVCGGQGTVGRHGNSYTCSRCGYTEQVGQLGKEPMTTSPTQLRNMPQGGPTPFLTPRVGSDIRSAVARRAQAVLDREA